MARLLSFFAAALAAMLVAAPALAGDTAEAEILGFSRDGGLFAFEEFGVQDGSGFPYSTIYVVDTDADRWVEGTPIRVLLQADGATLSEARARAEERFEAAFAGDFDEERATVLAHSPLGEVEADPVRLAFAPVLPAIPLGTPDRRYEARLELYYAEAETEDCIQVMGDRPMGFRLTIAREDGGSTVLHEDRGIPRSRGCPITYRLDRIVAEQYPPDRVAVLISVFRPGFEGPQRRFIAVTGRLPD